MSKRRRIKIIARVVIDGVVWRVAFGYPGKTSGVVDDGMCIYDEHLIIVRRPEALSCSLEEVIAHELLHAWMPQLREETVREFGESLGSVLDQLRRDNKQA